ncbi:uncharacterized protein N7477_004402 [Penicillium maclennaniae]|uniref:uncharacterized protein n=1 Tax=Penicillium maclennaniae TaxID=1343394 RepID=UPI002540EB21|nr:uncharacterized protein N7477_004402 [Penicillium maclennaniae]KAJ5674468.1 hypothetical protein N7477_004402 [Penicillium maclennaniae]
MFASFFWAFTSTIPNIANLKENIAVAEILISTSAWPGSIDNVVLGISTAVFTMVQTVANMAQIEKIADQYGKDEEKQLAEEIIMALFLVVPVLGEIDLISESLEGLANIIRMVGDASMLTNSIYDIATPDSGTIVMSIFGTLLLGGVRTIEDFNKMGSLRRSLTADDISKIGSEWEKSDTKMKNLISVCV